MAGGEILAETNASGSTTAEYIFFGGKRIAMLPAGGSVQYYVEDFLGSSRVVTQNNGVVCYDADFTPFGGDRPYTDNCPVANNYKFEGKERDTETGNDDFGARYYTWRFGRWLSADWSAVPVPVPYANLTNPQTLNLYAMVADDPESFADLDGHCGDGSGPSCVLQTVEVVTRFASDPGGFFKSFIWGGVKQELGTIRENLGMKPAPELSPSNDVERAGAATTAATIEAAAVVVPLVAGVEDEEPAGATLKPGPHAAESVPASGPRITTAEQTEINRIGQTSGCHTCGTKDPGTKSGNFVGDHQPSTALNQAGKPQSLYPQCLHCSQVQGGEVRAAQQAQPPPPPPPPPPQTPD